MRKLPAADKYEVRFYGPYRPFVFAADPGEAIAALDADGTIVAIKDCVGRVVAARVNGHLLNAREYRAYLDLTDGGKMRARVEASHA